MNLQQAIELRQKFAYSIEYLEALRLDKSKPLRKENLPNQAWLFDAWMDYDNNPQNHLQQKPERPSNYKLLDEHWGFVSIEQAFDAYPLGTIIALVEKEELYFVI